LTELKICTKIQSTIARKTITKDIIRSCLLPLMGSSAECQIMSNFKHIRHLASHYTIRK